jgi:two-component system cell cycle sensor histidine kinase/response regulator CckA
MPDPESSSHSPDDTGNSLEEEPFGEAPAPEGRIRMPDFEGLTDATEEIRVDVDDVDDASYVNSVRVQSSPEEFILDFIRVIPGVMEARLKSRVIVSPQNAKRLREALDEHLGSADRTSGEEIASTDPTATQGSLGPEAHLSAENGHEALDNPDSPSVPTLEPEVLTATFSDSDNAVHCNNPWTSLLGPTDRPWARLSEEDQDMAESAVLEALNGSLVTNRLVSAQAHHREEPLPILLNFIPVRGDSPRDGENCRAVTVSGEVLAEPPSWMLSQTQRHRMETLGRMTMGVAHDLNNLLSGLLGHIELLKDQVERASLTDSIRPSIETIETTAEDGAALIEKLQRYIRHDTQQHFEPLDLRDLIEDCITLTEPYWYNEPRRQGIEISVNTSFEDIPNILGAASELREVFVNLILNAVQAMPEGGTLQFEAFTSEEGRVCATVRDTGIGMSDEVQANIFEPLFTTKGDDGTGMGLAASYGIVQEHQGNIDVWSEPGEGTRFTLTFPPAEGEPAPVDESPAEPVESVGASVLVVDDDEMVRSTVTRLLTLSGHEVDQASAGAEALSTFADNDYDIVFTDFGMPEMTGAELARKLKEENPDLPIVLLTGYTETETAIDEVDGILSKPFKRDELDTAIQKHVVSSS